MKGIASVIQGYEAGGSVSNPFTAYANQDPATYTNPFLGLAGLPGRTEFVPTAPTPAPVGTNSGYRSIYGNLEAVKQEQQRQREGGSAVAANVPEVSGGPGESGGGAGGANGLGVSAPASTGYNPPALQGYDTPGKIAGAVGMATGLPLGPIVTGLQGLEAQKALNSYGIKDDLSLKDAILSGLSFGFLGKSIDNQVMDILNKPNNLTMYNEALLGMQGIPGLAAKEEIAPSQQTPTVADFEAATGIQAPTTEVATTAEAASAPDGFSAGDGGQDSSGAWAKGGYIPGKSGGMDDDVPALIDGKQPARLSSGEFVFDAATVAALGDGNNAAGAKKLNMLREAIRQKAYGHKKQMEENYSVGDLVRMYDSPRRKK